MCFYVVVMDKTCSGKQKKHPSFRNGIEDALSYLELTESRTD